MSSSPRTGALAALRRPVPATAIPTLIALVVAMAVVLLNPHGAAAAVPVVTITDSSYAPSAASTEAGAEQVVAPATVGTIYFTIANAGTAESIRISAFDSVTKQTYGGSYAEAQQPSVSCYDAAAGPAATYTPLPWVAANGERFEALMGFAGAPANAASATWNCKLSIKLPVTQPAGSLIGTTIRVSVDDAFGSAVNTVTSTATHWTHVKATAPAIELTKYLCIKGSPALCDANDPTLWVTQYKDIPYTNSFIPTYKVVVHNNGTIPLCDVHVWRNINTNGKTPIAGTSPQQYTYNLATSEPLFPTPTLQLAVGEWHQFTYSDTAPVNTKPFIGVISYANAGSCDPGGTPIESQDGPTGTGDGSPLQLGLTQDKVVDKASAAAGDTLTYTVTYTNTTTSTITFNAVDQYAAGTTIVSTAPAYTTASIPRRLIWSALTLEAGANLTITVEATIDAGSTGDLTNCVTPSITSPASGITVYTLHPSAVRAGSCATTNVPAQLPALTQDKKVDKATAAPGDLLTYTVTYGNSGPGAYTGNVLDRLPAGVTYVSSAPAATVTGQNLVWTGVSLPATTGTWTATVTATVNPGEYSATLTNSVRLQTPPTTLTVSDPCAAPNTAKASCATTTTPAPTAALGNLVWNDVDRNGRQNAGEPGIPGIAVTLKDSAGATVAATTTSATGIYGFSGLPAGTYSVCFAAAAGMVPTTMDAQGSSDFNDSDASTVTGCTADVPLGDNQINNTVDAGFWILAAELTQDKTVDKAAADPGDTLTYTITYANAGDAEFTGSVSDDLPAGVTYVSDDNAGTVVGQHVAWNITVAPGATKVIEVVATIDAGQWGKTLTNPVRLSVPPAAPTTIDVANPCDTDPSASCAVTVTPPQPAVCVGDLVWNDLDRDGVQDAGEPGIAGVTVTLTGPDGQAATGIDGSAVAAATTNSEGIYAFCSLPALPAGGHYTAHVDPTQPALAGFVPSPTGAGSAADDSSNGSAESGDLESDAAVDDTLDFGFNVPIVPEVCIGDYVWNDADRDGVQDIGEVGIPGVIVVITGPAGAVIDVDGNPVAPAATDDHGVYLFCGLPALPAGSHYAVAVDTESPALAGMVASPEGQGGNSELDSSTGSAESTDLTQDGDSDITLDFGFNVPKEPEAPVVESMCVTGTVAATGLTVLITGPNGAAVVDVSGNPVVSTVSGDQGAYSFCGLPVLAQGSYEISVRNSSPQSTPTPLPGELVVTKQIDTGHGDDAPGMGAAPIALAAIALLGSLGALLVLAVRRREQD